MKIRSLLLLAVFAIAGSAWGQDVKAICRDLPKGQNNFVASNESLVTSAEGTKACHLETSLLVEAHKEILAEPIQRCLIVEKEHRLLSGPLRSQKFDYRDALNFAGKVKEKYSEGDLNKIRKTGTHVVILNAGEAGVTREICR